MGVFFFRNFVLHVTSSFSIVPRFVGFFMRARAVIFALLLAVSGTYGCALNSVPSAPAIPELGNPPQIAAITPAVSPAFNPALLELMRQQDKQEETLFDPISLSATLRQVATSEKANEKIDSQIQPAKLQEPRPRVLQKAKGPSADDQLLELVEKDLKKAVEQPVERRRLEFSKAVVQNKRVRYFINYFSKSQKEQFSKALARSGRYFPMIAEVLLEEGLPEELAYLVLIESESSPHAASPSGAAGLWQFVPSTARRYGLKIDAWVDERRDPVKSTHAAAAYLKDLYGYFGRWSLATAAYNAGEGAIDRAIQSSGAKDFWTLARKAKLSEETLNFVPKFVAASLIASDPKKYGLGEIPYDTPLDYEEVEVRGNLPLAAAAELAGTDADTVQELNPALVRNQTPPSEDRFILKLPTGYAKMFAQAYHEFWETKVAQVITHEVQQGETLFSIARRYGQKVRALMAFNGLTTTHLRIGQKLKVILEGIGGGLR